MGLSECFPFFQSDDAVNPDRLYDLMAVVIHCGSGPNRGHYISIVKSHGFWLLFDDDMVDVSDFFLLSLYQLQILIDQLFFSENRSIHYRGLLRAHVGHPEVVRNGLHPLLPVTGRDLKQQQVYVCFDLGIPNPKSWLRSLS